MVGGVLHELRISDLGVIAEAVLQPHPGFTVVTGETGAGKTMIVTALDLISGGRADAARVRAGRERAVVECRFGVDPAGETAAAVAAAGGRLDDDGTLISVRTVGSDGRSRAHVGGRSVPLGTLTELTEPLIAVHGQSQAISLLRPAQQRAVLDQFAGLTKDVQHYRERRARWQQLTAELADGRAKARERSQREHLLALGLAEIDSAAPLSSEDRHLVAEARRLEDVDGLRAAAQAGLGSLSGTADFADATGGADAPTAVALVQDARHALEAAGDPRLAALAGQVQQASVVLADVGAELCGYLSNLDADPDRLQQVLARQAQLRALTRRYGPDVDAVLAWAVDARAELAELDSSDHRLAGLQAELDGARVLVGQSADRISQQRQAAAARLGEQVSTELDSLAMARAVVRVRLSRRAASADDPDAVQIGDKGSESRWVVAGLDGVDQVEIIMVAHPGAPELPIARGASGGELSRVMLALEVALADADPVSTLVFDEVDAGVGGRAATEIGSRLAALSRNHQVIVVTHLAQVAAFADRHYVVDAAADGHVGTSDLREVSDADREAELARMLGGTDGDIARAHARDLLASAARTAGTVSPAPAPAPEPAVAVAAPAIRASPSTTRKSASRSRPRTGRPPLRVVAG